MLCLFIRYGRCGEKVGQVTVRGGGSGGVHIDRKQKGRRRKFGAGSCGVNREKIKAHEQNGMALPRGAMQGAMMR